MKRLFVCLALLASCGRTVAQEILPRSVFETKIENKMYNYICWKLAVNPTMPNCEVLRYNNETGEIILRFWNYRAGWDVIEFVPEEGRTESYFVTLSGTMPTYDEWGCTNFEAIFRSL